MTAVPEVQWFINTYTCIYLLISEIPVNLSPRKEALRRRVWPTEEQLVTWQQPPDMQ